MSELSALYVGGKEYFVNDLNLKAIQRIWPMMSVLSDPKNPDYMSCLNKALGFALAKSNPDLTEEFLAENVSVEEIFTLGTFISEQLSKLTKKKNPATSVAMMSQSTGGISTPESLPQLDGAGNT